MILKTRLCLACGGREVFLGQEGDRGSRASQSQEAALEVDDAEVPFEHVQPEQEVHVARLSEKKQKESKKIWKYGNMEITRKRKNNKKIRKNGKQEKMESKKSRKWQMINIKLTKWQKEENKKIEKNKNL